MNIKLSIIVPVYKVEKYVGQCLASILNDHTATLPIEVIVVNDVTPDNSMAVVAEYTKYPCLSVIHQENQGLSMARNAGLAQASGEYVWFIDSDDWLMDGAVDKVMEIISRDNAPDLISAGLLWTYEDEKKNHADMTRPEAVTISGHDYLNRGALHGAIQRFVIRRSILTDYNITFYPGILHEDGLFGKQIVYLSETILILPQPIYFYRQRDDGSIMHKITIRSAYDNMTMHKEVVKFCKDHIKKEEQVWFRSLALKDLNSGIINCWDLRHTTEFKKFLKDSQKHRNEECDYLMFKNGAKDMMRCILMKYFPVFYCWLIKKIVQLKQQRTQSYEEK